MPAVKESSLAVNSIGCLGIIAGGGDIPRLLLHACDAAGQDVFIVGFEGQTDPEIMEGRNYMMTRLGAAGQIFNTLKAHGVNDLVMIGYIRRPSLAELKPDMRTAQFFARLGLRALGDDSLLKALREELEHEGFAIHGIQKFVKDLLAEPGDIGRHKPKKPDWVAIERGIEASQALGKLDIGQAVIVQEEIVLGVEGAEGTDELIKRCAGYKRKGRGGVLVKTCKPQQDQDFDLPTIGPQTVRLCAQTGLSGIVVQAGKSLLVDREQIAKIADEHGLFVTAVNMEEPRNAT